MHSPKGSQLIIESPIGRYSIVADKFDDNRVVIYADNARTLSSIVDSIELMGGAHNDSDAFDSSVIHPDPIFGRERYSLSLSRAQLLRHLEYETLNFLTYSSLTQMRSI
jgi:hypothetical protein